MYEHSDPQVFSENIDRYIQHGSVPAGTSPVIHMPAFGDTDSLSQQEIANIEAYILHVNGVDRAQLVSSGMEPKKFFLLVVVTYGMVAPGLSGIWNKRRGRMK